MGVLTAKWVAARDFLRGRNKTKIQSIILHSTCGTRVGDIPTLTEAGGPVVSCHFYITRDGALYQFVEIADTAFHAGVVAAPTYENKASIGIEQEHFDPDKDHPDGQDWPEAQVRTCAQLVAFLRQKYGQIPVAGHAVVARPVGRKEDPAGYPWKRFSELVQESMREIWTLRRA